MKKLLSVLLTALMILGITPMAFAKENVDNTFDNYLPAPYQKAPDNWYDPYCYDENGIITLEALSGRGDAVVYCQKEGKAFTIRQLLQDADGKKFRPYCTFISEFGEVAGYCPYCGDAGTMLEHEYVKAVVYGCFCPKCDKFSANYNFNKFNKTGLDKHYCNNYDCQYLYDPVIDNLVVYRFITEEQRTADYAHIFKDSEFMYGEGQDGRYEDLCADVMNGFCGWNPGMWQPKKTFFQKIADFFESIGNAFSKFFALIGSIFTK